MIITLTISTLCPVFLSGLFALLEKKARFPSFPSMLRQAPIGIAFSLFAICSTQFGVKISDQTIINVWDSAPLCTGLLFGEILIYSALFTLIYQMMKKKEICNLQKVNSGLNEITIGTLDTLIDVRSHKEFSEVSDHINATVGNLKRYIKENSVTVFPDIDSLRLIASFLEERLSENNISPKTQNQVQVATDEIYSNIVHYSNASYATISLDFKEDSLTLVFQDNGIPFDPTIEKEPDISLSAQEREIGGLGILMVRKMSLSMHYEYKEETNNLTVTFAR